MVEQSTEAFRRYLEESGTIDCVANALAALFELEEKPKTTVDFLKSQLGAPTSSDYDQLAQEKKNIEMELAEARSQIEVLEAKLIDLQNSNDEQIDEQDTNE